MSMFRNFLYTAAVFTVAAIGSTAAQAAPFGNSTASIGGLYNPTVTDSTVDVSNGTPTLFSGTGQLNPPGSAAVTVSGPFTYSQSVAAIVADPMGNFLSFSDGAGGTDIFSLSTVETTGFVNQNNSESIDLYLLGTLSDPSEGLDATATSVTMTLNDNNGGPFTFSATLSDPPTTPVIITTVPEPLSLALLASGLIGLGVMRRRKAS